MLVCNCSILLRVQLRQNTGTDSVWGQECSNGHLIAETTDGRTSHIRQIERGMIRMCIDSPRVT